MQKATFVPSLEEAWGRDIPDGGHGRGDGVSGEVVRLTEEGYGGRQDWRRGVSISTCRVARKPSLGP